MSTTKQLQAWGSTLARARRAEAAALRSGPPDAGALWRTATVLRQRADRLHRAIYQSLSRSRGQTPG